VREAENARTCGGALQCAACPRVAGRRLNPVAPHARRTFAPQQMGSPPIERPGMAAKKGRSISDSLVGVGIVFKHDKHKEWGGGLTVVALVPGGAAGESGQVSVGMQVRRRAYSAQRGRVTAPRVTAARRRRAMHCCACACPFLPPPFPQITLCTAVSSSWSSSMGKTYGV